MSLVQEFGQLWADFNPRLAELTAEVAALRASVTVPEAEATVSELHDTLVAADQALDRVETILAEVGRARSRTRVAVAEAQDAYDDQWRTVMQQTRVGEYSSAQERNATYQAGSVEQLIILRRVKRMLADVEESFDYINLKHRGLVAAARELDSRMRSRIGEFSRLER